MSLWTSAAIAAACGGTEHGAFACEGVSFDSREVTAGDLFIALTGEATDGHRFVESAQAKGAAGMLVSQPVPGPHVRVADTMAALNALGAAARDRSGALRIGVTGSVGKTGVKEALNAALGRFAPDAVHASVKSYNNHTGVPLSLARMPAASRFGVFEMGMNHAGELAALTQLVQPHIAIVTWVASAHREFFATEADIAQAKAEIFGGLPAGGTAIIPADNPHAALLEQAACDAGAAVVRFGLSDSADVRAEQVALHPDCSCVTASINGQRLIFKVGMAGRHWVNNALAVLAGVDAAGGDLALAGLALADMNGLPGRGRRLRVSAGSGQAIIIDEAYNANPASMAASLAVLRDVTPARQGRRIALLGAMKELGAHSDDLHMALAGDVLSAGVTLAVLVGAEMRPLANILKRQVDVRHVADADAALAELAPQLAADDVLLVKGSNSMQLARVIEALADPKDAAEVIP
jgi:UDP-N-acetylmuramoyl-tripeptide--D-alanyl-D-alanine ligase